MRTDANAFTRIEIVTILAVLALLGAFAVPLLGGTRQNGQRASCFNNLRLVGNAAQRWASDHGEQTPWWTSVNDGGTLFGRTVANAWFEWTTFSNELVTPVLLTCPSDSGARVATAFDASPTGLFSSGMRDNAISYIIGLHAQRGYPQAVLAMDRNVRFDSLSRVGCSTQLPAHPIARPFSNAGWTNAVHGGFGHVLLFDGRLEAASWNRVQQLFAADTYAGGTEHFLTAR